MAGLEKVSAYIPSALRAFKSGSVWCWKMCRAGHQLMCQAVILITGSNYLFWQPLQRQWLKQLWRSQGSGKAIRPWLWGMRCLLWWHSLCCALLCLYLIRGWNGGSGRACCQLIVRPLYCTSTRLSYRQANAGFAADSGLLLGQITAALCSQHSPCFEITKVCVHALLHSGLGSTGRWMTAWIASDGCSLPSVIYAVIQLCMVSHPAGVQNILWILWDVSLCRASDFISLVTEKHFI